MVFYRGYGELSYGSIDNPLSEFGIYRFPPTYTLSINAKPIMSDNGVNVKWNRYELTVNWIVPFELIGGRFNPIPQDANNVLQSVDTAVEQIRQILMTPRLELTCQAQGFDLNFTRNKNTDANDGPTPLDFKWKVLATQRCVEMSWTVAFHQTNGIFLDKDNQQIKKASVISDFSWSRTYDLDEFGAATITTTGTIHQASEQFLDQNGTPVPSTTKHVDNWRMMAYFPVPTYCKRVSQKFQHNPTTRSMTFTLVDKELPTENAYPPLVVDIDLSHEISSSLVDAGKFTGQGFLTWNNVFSGNITLKPGVSPLYAYFLFHFYLRQRLNRVNHEITVEGVTTKEGVAKDISEVPIKNEYDSVGTPTIGARQATEKVRTLLTRVTYKESLFSRTHSFKAEYWALYSREKFISQSGIFLPLYNYTQRSSGGVPWFEGTNQDKEPWTKDFNRSSSFSLNSLNRQWEWREDLNDAQVIGNDGPYGYLVIEETSKNRGPYGSTKLFVPNDVFAQSHDTYVDYLEPRSLDAWNIEDDIYSQANYNSTKTDTYAGAKAYVDPEISWIDYKINTTIVENINTSQVVRQSYDASIDAAMKSFQVTNAPTPEVPLPSPEARGKPTKGSRNFSINNAGVSGLDQPAGEVVSTFNGQPSSIIILSGYAIRAGLPIPIPSILSYQNKAVYRAGQAMYSNRIISKSEIPVYLATWSIPYYIDNNKHRDVFKDLKINGYTGELG